MTGVTEIFGSNVFSDEVMRARLPRDVYDALLETTRNGHHLNPAIADAMAAAMKDWAIEKGATHYTHWFQPMTGITAEKHDSFLVPTEGGGCIMDFSGKELFRGESDASSFPSGGLRATFEARGYTAWDPTSYVFIKDGTLCIPTAFCSFGGEALDKKTPLLRSMEALNRQAMRVLRLFGNEDVHSVRPTVGAEQEYFLIDRALFEKRKDLIYTGRTLFGARPPKGQELDDHYYGAIKPRVHAFMRHLDEELWKLGIAAKTEHNEAAPGQHELAPVFQMTNIAADHNQLMMETMQKIAKEHGMICLLHEKPFEGVNGSGKHNNWSISTDTGLNLMNPGDTPSRNAQFLLFLCAVIKAVDEYQDLLRISVTSASNDHRLGSCEAPPAVLSIFLGDELSAILDAIERGTSYDEKEKVQLKVGVHILPRFPKDNTDRNRTSPFAFTGNKFEFRMLGSSDSISDANTVLNTAVAESLRQFADRLEGAADFESELHDLIRDTIRGHRRIIFNGNGYGEEWLEEAKRRGLSELKTTPDALPHLLDGKNVELFARHRVYSEAELHSRFEIMEENYAKILTIEALTMIDMARKDILPAVSRFAKTLADTVNAKTLAGSARSTYEETVLSRVSKLTARAFDGVEALEKALAGARAITDAEASGFYFRDSVLPAMQELRTAVDTLESMTSAAEWPYPSVGELLFSVR
ncbi:MAG: glutamine synthetase III [Clostridia bacterium]|nr:glutamine synthetase III [Clostridia bacterium]